MEKKQSFHQEFSETYNISQKQVIEMESCYWCLWTVAHSLNKIVLLQILVENGFSRDDIYKRCGDDLQELKEMFVECSFYVEMGMRGINETKKGERAMWGMLEYFGEI
jgi:hypothetical protein